MSTSKNGKHQVIQVTAEKNPKRPGSKAHKKFSVLMKMNGKPVEDFKALQGKHPVLDKEPHWATTELRWALKLGLAKLKHA